jgi:hypothetical protein
MQAAAILIPVRPCIKCAATRRDKNGNCLACARVLSKAWYEANKDRAKASMRAWHTNNPEKSKAGNEAWRKANPEKVKAMHQTDAHKASVKAWQKANPEKLRAATEAWKVKNPLELRIYQSNSRAKELGIPGKLSSGIVSKLFKLQQGTCPCCRQPLGEDFQIDHVVALHNKGANTKENIQLLRAACNGSKRIQDPLSFMQGRGYLL